MHPERKPAVTLGAIDDANRDAVIALRVSPQQLNFVSSVADSLAEAAAKKPSALGDIAARYGLEVDRESIPRLTAEYGLHFGTPPAE